MYVGRSIVGDGESNPTFRYKNEFIIFVRFLRLVSFSVFLTGRPHSRVARLVCRPKFKEKRTVDTIFIARRSRQIKRTMNTRVPTVIGK